MSVVIMSICKIIDTFSSFLAFWVLYQLEGTFYPKHVLRDISSAFVGCYIGTGRKAWRRITSFQNSLMDLIVMEEKGIRLLGNPVEFYRPSSVEIAEEQKTTIKSLESAIQDDAGIGDWHSLIHWCARTIVHNRTKEIVSKGDACRWCQSNLRRKEFDRLFNMAENRRYPYGDDTVSDEFRAMCKKLLAYTGELANGG